MSEKCRYVAIDGSVVSFGTDGKLFIGQGHLRTYSWLIHSDYGYISRFGKDDILTKNNTIYIRGTPQEVKGIANEIFNVFDRDVEYKNNHPESSETGRLYIGDCYLKCFIISSVPACYLTHRCFLKKDIALVTDSPDWIKEKQYSFYNISKYVGTKKYAYKYPYAYISALNNEFVTNDFSQQADFEFEIENAEGCSSVNPYLIIGNQSYQFMITLSEGEKLKINSIDRTIIKTDAAGNTEDALYTRNKAYDVFAKIPVGKHYITLAENTKASVKLLQKRSEPEWI